MDTFNNDPSKIYSKMKKARGEEVKRIEIPFIETLAGKYTGDNVLEGFCANTEILCNEDENGNKFNNEIYKMFTKDNMIIFDITSEEEVAIPQMNLSQLKDILFKKLKLNKACDVFKLTVEHLRYVGDEKFSSSSTMSFHQCSFIPRAEHFMLPHLFIKDKISQFSTKNPKGW